MEEITIRGRIFKWKLAWRDGKKWKFPELVQKKTDKNATLYDLSLNTSSISLKVLSKKDHACFSLRAEKNTHLSQFKFSTPSLVFPCITVEARPMHMFYQRFKLWADPTYKLLPGKTNVISSMIAMKDRNTGETIIISPLNNPFTTYVYLRSNRKVISFGGAFNGELGYIPAGKEYSFIIVVSDGIREGILRWGELVRKYNRKKDTTKNVVLEKIGYWTDAGMYYYYRREKGINYADTVINAIKSLEKAGIMAGYLELDSWFYLKGRDNGVLSWEPDLKLLGKPPDKISKETGLPLVLHNRYFSIDSPFTRIKQFRFRVKRKLLGIVGTEHMFLGSEAFPGNPEKVYEKWAAMAKKWNCCGYEQDWLDTQYKRIKALRSDPHMAERWIFGMFDAMERHGIPTILCMPNPAFYLAGGMHKNAAIIRTSNDYIFRKPMGVIAKITNTFISRFHYQGNRRDLWRANLLNSLIAWALGMYPFFDAFITSKNHPHNFGESYNVEESIMRVLSCGPVGIGDRAGYFDRNILLRMALQDGTLVKPDRPALPMEESLEEDPATSGLPLLMETYSDISGYKWQFLLFVNLNPQKIEYCYKIEKNQMAYHWRSGRFVKNHELIFTIPPLSIRYFVLAPKIGDIWIIPDALHYVVASKQVIEKIENSKGHVSIYYRKIHPPVHSLVHVYTKTKKTLRVGEKEYSLPPGAHRISLQLGKINKIEIL